MHAHTNILLRSIHSSSDSTNNSGNGSEGKQTKRKRGSTDGEASATHAKADSASDAGAGGFKKARHAHFGPLPASCVEALSAQLGLEEAGVAAKSAVLLCRSEAASVVCRVAPQLAALVAPPDSATAVARKGALRIVFAGCTLARRSRKSIFQPTVEGARYFAPQAAKKRRLKLKGEDARLLLRRSEEPSKARRALPIGLLSPKVAEQARALPPGPCLLLLHPEGQKEPLALPGRRLQSGELLRLVLPHTAGLENRGAAVLHAAKAFVGSGDA